MPTSLLGVVPHGLYLAQYNGYTFDPATTYTDAIDCVPVPDAAGRTIKWVKANLSLVTRVYTAPPTTTDNTMEALERKLMSFGGALYYRDKGFGDFNVNVPGGLKRDVNWGPKPTHFKAKPLADAYCWEVRWGVEVCYPWCDAARFENDLVEWNYRVYTDHDDGGYETRRIVGHIEIPLSRKDQGDRLIRQTADDYREVIAPACPRWFRPATDYFELSDDRRRLTFQFSFAQLPGPVPPPGVLKVSLSDALANDGAMNFQKWTWNVRAEYELIAGFPHATAFQHFVVTVGQLLTQMAAEIRAAGLKNPKGAENHEGGAQPGWWAQVKDFLTPWPVQALKGAAEDIRQGVAQGIRDAFGIKKKPAQQRDGLTFLPMYFSAENPDRYGKPKCNFSCAYSIVGTARTWLTAGLWTPLPGDNDWETWKKTIDQAFGPRGQLGGRFNPADDVIIDLCRPGVARLRGRRPRAEPLRLVINPPLGGSPIPVKVDQESNWVHLQNDLELLQDDAVVSYKPLPQDRTLTARRGATLKSGGFGPGTQSAGGLAAFVPPTAQEFISTVARQVATTYRVLMTGYGVRVGTPAEPYGLVSVGGVPAVPCNDSRMGDGCRTTTIGNVGLPVYLTYWQQRYLLPAAPGQGGVDPDSGAPVGPDTARPAAQAPAAGPRRAAGIVAGRPAGPGRGLSRY